MQVANEAFLKRRLLEMKMQVGNVAKKAASPVEVKTARTRVNRKERSNGKENKELATVV